MGWDRTVSNDERKGTLLAHFNELFLLLSQVQHSPAGEDGICHEVPQSSLPQVPLQVRAKGRREGDYLRAVEQSFSNFRGHISHLGILIKCGF